MTEQLRIPTQDQIALLPRWARIAFATRCAHRVLIRNRSLLSREDRSLKIAADAIRYCEKAATNAKVFVTYDKEWYDPLNALDDWLAAVGSTVKATDSLNVDIREVYEAADQAHLFLGQNFGVRPDNRSQNAIRQDFDILLYAAREHNWNDDTPVPPQFFSHHSAFDLDPLIEDRGIIEISAILSRKLLEYLQCRPTRLYELSPRQFEELIAKLWDSFGFEVELTKRTRDGGKDIVAIRHSPCKLMYLIECKRYGPTNPVGIEVVQRLYGVTHMAGADKGLLATTSRFTKPAKDTLKKAAWLLEGHDFDGLTKWLDKYQQIQMYRSLSIDPSEEL